MSGMCSIASPAFSVRLEELKDGTAGTINRTDLDDHHT